MNENELGKRISLLASQMGHRLFRMNSGLAWVGKIIRFSKPMKIEVFPGDVLIKNARAFHAGFPGMCDYGGWSKDGRTMWTEIKTETGAIRPEQKIFIDAVVKSGGIAGIVRNDEDAFELFS